MVQGKLVNETRCLQCETTTSRQEAFYELSLEIEQNSSLSTCLRNFRQGWPAPCALSCATLHEEADAAAQTAAPDTYFPGLLT